MTAELEQRGWPVLLALAITAAPLAWLLPVWLFALTGLMLVGRALLLWRGAPLPSRWLLRLAVLMSMLGLWLSFRTLVGREGGVALLLLLVGFKALETNSLRDWQVLLILGFFLAATPLLFDQSPLAALCLVLSLLALTWAMALLAGELLQGSLRTALLALGLALPLMLVLFLFMPRLSEPLWGVPLATPGVASTGFSEQMEPGSISRLIQNREPAFAAVFADDPQPARAQLYWRMLVFSQFDGRSWTVGQQMESEAFRVQGGMLREYSVTLRPDKRRLPALDLPQQTLEGSRLLPGLLLRHEQTAEDLVRYRGWSLLGASYYAPLSDTQRAVYLSLPPGNPKTRELAQQLRLRSSDEISLTKAMLEQFRLGDFRYTLTPPLLGDDGIDQFLFITRQGFCEHYASALAVLARAAGMPARVVIGYQGGEFNPVGRFWQLRSSDAHAWVEVWLSASQQWLRLDPTMAVSPDRLERGVEQVFPSLQPAGAALLPNAWWLMWQQNTQAAGFVWQQWVVGYDLFKQQNLFRQLGLGEELSAVSVLKALLVGLLLASLPFVFWWQHRRKPAPLVLGWHLLGRYLARRKLMVEANDGPLDRISKAKALSESEYLQIKNLIEHYIRLRYRQLSVTDKEAQQWLQRVRRLR
ncbi:DUF3488 and transglutaminase-like domain-containing protein [Neisseriaceae bacterium TC5R-5]|nr:DUF3488 and transglutaminase-like domain-containing protein [Neisseriaceae bacterium TC5R-5]